MAKAPVKGFFSKGFLERCEKFFPRKSAEKGEICRIILCKPKKDSPRFFHMWKTLVEKPVENVEKFDFSTGIPAVLKNPAWGRSG